MLSIGFANFLEQFFLLCKVFLDLWFIELLDVSEAYCSISRYLGIRCVLSYYSAVAVVEDCIDRSVGVR